MQFLEVVFGAISVKLHFKRCLGTPVNIGSGFGLVLWGNNPKPEQVLTKIDVSILRH